MRRSREGQESLGVGMVVGSVPIHMKTMQNGEMTDLKGINDPPLSRDKVRKNLGKFEQEKIRRKTLFDIVRS